MARGLLQSIAFVRLSSRLLTDQRGPVSDVNDSSEKLVILVVDHDTESCEAPANLRLNEDSIPALIILDLMMPVTSGWEFRAAKDRSQIEVATHGGHDC